MSRKFISVIITIVIMASMSITAFAAPADTAAAAAQSAAPAATTGFATGNDNALTEKIKAMSDMAKALSADLKQEKQLDQKLRSQIQSLKNIKSPDPGQIKAYEAELKPLTAKLKKLTQDLKKEDQKKGKKRDEAKIAELKAGISQVMADIAAVNTKYKDLLAQIEKNKNAHKKLDELRKKLQPMYDSLRTKVNAASKLDREIDRLVAGLKSALKANNTTKAEASVTAVLAKMDALKANIADRIAIRNQMLGIVEAYTN